MFEMFRITKIDRTVNGKADALARLATASRAIDLRRIFLLGRNKSILEETRYDMLTIEVGDIWMTEILNWLRNDILPEDQVQARTVQKRSLIFYLDREVLYKRGFKGPDFEMCRPSRGQIDIAGNPRGDLWKPLRREIVGR